jgi:hypothetical protein
VSTTVHTRLPLFRISERSAQHWLWSQAPCSWPGNVDIEMMPVDFSSLEPARTLKHWDVLAIWTRQMACRRQIPPLIVSLTERGTCYIHDGNHRYEALRICYRNHLLGLQIPVAVFKPKVPYRFVLREYTTHSTYQLVRLASRPAQETSVRMYNLLNRLKSESAVEQ